MRECGSCTWCHIIAPGTEIPISPGCLWFEQPGLSKGLRPDLCNMMFNHIVDTSIYRGQPNPNIERPWDEFIVRVLIRKITDSGSSVVIECSDSYKEFALGDGKTLAAVQQELNEKEETF